MSESEPPLFPRTYTHRERDLVDFCESDLDTHIAALIDRYQDASPAECARLRASLSATDAHSLFTYTRRAALRSVRTGDPQLVAGSLIGLAAVAQDRVDQRDLMWAIDIAIAALNHVHGSPTEARTRAALMADDNAHPLARRADTTTFSDALLYFHDGNPSGLIDRGIHPFDPRIDLANIALRVGRALAGLGLEPHVTVATDLPGIWFGGPSTPDPEGWTAAATVSCNPTPSHMLTAFVAEFADDTTAAMYEHASHQHDGQFHANLTVRNHAVLSVLIARSTVVGVDAIETRTSLDRFRQPITEALT